MNDRDSMTQQELLAMARHTGLEALLETDPALFEWALRRARDYVARLDPVTDMYDEPAHIYSLGEDHE